MTQRNDIWFFEDVILQVQDELFRVPRYRFEDDSELFRLMSPRPLERHAQGCSNHSPLRLYGFSKQDFVHFLNELYSTDEQPIDTTKKDLNTYESILKVSICCGFQNIRQQAIWYISTMLEPESCAITQINLAQTYGVSEWLYNGYLKLANRPAHLTWQEIEILGSRNVANVLMLREMRYRTIEEQPADHLPSVDSIIEAQMSLNSQSPTSRNSATYEIVNVSLTPELRITLAKEAPKTDVHTQQPTNLHLDSGSGCSPTRPAYPGKNELFYFESIIFEVEDELFKVPKVQFQRHSEVFSDMFSLPQGPETEGKIEQRPLRLEGITKRDFELFLSMLYTKPSFAQSDSTPVLQLWEATLKLSSMWLFDDLRHQSITALTNILSSDHMAVKEVVFGQTYRVRSWLVQGYLKLAMRTSPLTAQEREAIGLRSALCIMELQLSRYVRVPRLVTRSITPTFWREEVSVEDVERAFAAELADVKLC